MNLYKLCMEDVRKNVKMDQEEGWKIIEDNPFYVENPFIEIC